MRKGLIRTSISAVGVVACLVLAACGDDDDGATGAGGGASETTASADSDEPRQGGTLTHITVRDLDRGMDPAFLTATTLQGGEQGVAVFGQLVFVNPDTLEVEPQMAESLTTEDGRVWTLKLRPDVQFTDGTPYDAEAVKFNWERLADPELASLNASQLEAIESLEVVDPLTLQITLKDVTPQWDVTVARAFSFIGSPTALRAGGGADFAANPVGAGPFTLVSWQRGVRTEFERNPDYWDAPRPYLDRYVIRYVAERGQGADALRVGEGDTLYEQDPDIVDAWLTSGGEGLSTPEGGGLTLWFQQSRPPFDELDARRAVAMAVDIDEANQIVQGGLAEQVDTLMLEGSPYYEPGITQAEHDAEAAQALFDELAQERGEPLSFTLTIPNNWTELGQFLQAHLNEYDNVDVGLDVVNVDAVFEVYARGDFDVTIGAPTWTADPAPILTEVFAPDGPRNFTGYVNPDVTAALQTAATTLDEDERKDAYRIVQENLLSDVPMLWLWRQAQWNLYTDHVRDFTVVEEGVPRVDMIWLDE